MIAGDGEDGGGIVAVGFVKLIIVIGGFAEIVDDVAEMEEEGGTVGVGGVVEVGGHLIGNGEFVAEFFLVGGAGVADGVEDDFAVGLDGADDLGASRAERLLEGVEIGGLAARGIEGSDVFVEEILDLLVERGVGGMVDLEFLGVGGDRGFAEDGLGERVGFGSRHESSFAEDYEGWGEKLD